MRDDHSNRTNMCRCIYHRHILLLREIGNNALLMYHIVPPNSVACLSVKPHLEIMVAWLTAVAICHLSISGSSGIVTNIYLCTTQQTIDKPIHPVRSVYGIGDILVGIGTELAPVTSL